MKELRNKLNIKLASAIVELKNRRTLTDIQRLYGFCLGVRAVLIELDRQIEFSEYDQSMRLVDDMLDAGLSQMNKKQALEYLQKIKPGVTNEK